MSHFFFFRVLMERCVAGIQGLPRHAFKNLMMCSISSEEVPEIKGNLPPRSHFSDWKARGWKCSSCPSKALLLLSGHRPFISPPSILPLTLPQLRPSLTWSDAEIGSTRNVYGERILLKMLLWAPVCLWKVTGVFTEHSLDKGGARGKCGRGGSSN